MNLGPAQLRMLLESAPLETASEAAFQESVARVLTENGLEFRREVRLNKTDRVDFLVGRVGLELKVKGAPNEVLRQMLRYAQSDQIDAILLLTTRYRHCTMPHHLNNKPLLVALFQRALA